MLNHRKKIKYKKYLLWKRFWVKKKNVFVFLSWLAGMHLPAPSPAVNSKWTEPRSPGRHLGSYLFVITPIWNSTCSNVSVTTSCKIVMFLMSNPIPNLCSCLLVPLKVVWGRIQKPGKVRDSFLPGATCVRACMSVVTHQPQPDIATAPNFFSEESPHRMTRWFLSGYTLQCWLSLQPRREHSTHTSPGCSVLVSTLYHGCLSLLFIWQHVEGKTKPIHAVWLAFTCIR